MECYFVHPPHLVWMIFDAPFKRQMDWAMAIPKLQSVRQLLHDETQFPTPGSLSTYRDALIIVPRAQRLAALQG